MPQHHSTNIKHAKNLIEKIKKKKKYSNTYKVSGDGYLIVNGTRGEPLHKLLTEQGAPVLAPDGKYDFNKFTIDTFYHMFDDRGNDLGDVSSFKLGQMDGYLRQIEGMKGTAGLSGSVALEHTVPDDL